MRRRFIWKNACKLGTRRSVMDLNLKGRTALVCSSTKGLGWASAQALTAEGVRVALNGRSKTTVDAKAGQLGDSSVGLDADISTAEGALGLAQRALVELEHIDILVLNSPGPQGGPAVGQDIEDVRAAFESLVVAQT